MRLREPYEQTLKDLRNYEIDQILRFMSAKPVSAHNGTRIPPLGQNQLWRSYYLYRCGPNDGINDMLFYTFSKQTFIENMEKSYEAAQLDAKKVFSFNSTIPDVWYLRDLRLQLDNYRLSDSNKLTHWHFLLLSLALQTFKKQHGKFPQNLSELSPKILKTLPIDPFSPTKSTFKFKNLGKDYLLYSVGPNNVDDDTKPMPYEPNSSLDIVFKHALNDKIQIPAGTKTKKPSGTPPLFPIPLRPPGLPGSPPEPLSSAPPAP